MRAVILAVITNLGVSGLDLHSKSSEPVNFFGEQSLLGRAQFSFWWARAVIWGARPRNPPRGAGPVWAQKLAWFLLNS